MYQVGDKVLYGMHGVCCILNIEVKTVDRKKISYYVLEPLDQPGTRFYIPTQNLLAVSKLSKLLSARELETILNHASENAGPWIADETLRKQKYRELINSGDREALLGMIHVLHQHKQQQTEAGKKFHLCDENFLRDAQRLLSVEFSLVTGIPQDQIGAYIADKMK